MTFELLPSESNLIWVLNLIQKFDSDTMLLPCLSQTLNSALNLACRSMASELGLKFTISHYHAEGFLFVLSSGISNSSRAV